jgi:hypothetical protein
VLEAVRKFSFHSFMDHAEFFLTHNTPLLAPNKTLFLF